MHTKDGNELDIQGTDRFGYTLDSICSEDWMIADFKNCLQMGGEATFSLNDSIRYLKRGLKVARKGWNGKRMHVLQKRWQLNL